jgi:hypothetical protein
VRSDAWLSRPPSRYAGTPGRPLLIGGCPRSGTTLVRALLDNHPGIAVPPETNFVLPVWHDRASFSSPHEVAEWIFGGQGRGGRRLRGDLPRDEVVALVAAGGPSLGGVLAAAFAVYASRTGKPRWGDKRPRYAAYLDALFALWPDAQFVNVVRDPRGAVASQIPMGWDPPETALEGSTANWLMSVERVDAAARKLRPDQLLDVRYEQLVHDPRAELARICTFAGLDTSDAVLDATLASDRRGKRDGHERVAKPITPDRIESWRHRLEPEAVALVEHAAAAHMERLGYVPVADASPTPESLAELRRQRADRARRFRRAAARDLLRRVTYRRPVAAPPGSGSVLP